METTTETEQVLMFEYNYLPNSLTKITVQFFHIFQDDVSTGYTVKVHHVGKLLDLKPINHSFNADQYIEARECYRKEVMMLL